MVTVQSLLNAYTNKKYKLFNYPKVNLFGVRNTQNKDSNNFNDILGVLYQDTNSTWILKSWAGTTDAGLAYRLSPINNKGTAILVPNQYIDGFRFGKHHGKYNALVQNKPFTLYRDNNKDSKLDYINPQDPEMAGINIHKAGVNSIQVDKWSAGCQVFAKEKDFNEFMDILNSANCGNTFTYTLFLDTDLLV